MRDRTSHARFALRQHLRHPRGWPPQALGPMVTSIALFVVETLQRN
jgi:hypothetical protein